MHYSTFTFLKKQWNYIILNTVSFQVLTGVLKISRLMRYYAL
jgi:hypothetical protein